MDYILYPGCLITYRFPFIEKMTRLAFNELDINLIEPIGFTCCPDPQGMQSHDKKKWILTAARNLALADRLNLDIFTICNGCYGTFRKVAHILNDDIVLKDEINEELSKLNLEFKGKIKVKHIHEVLLRDIGLKKLNSKITNPLSAIKIAIHYGCKLIRPSNIVEFNDGKKSTSLEQIIDVFGAKVVDYEDQLACCGGFLNYFSEIESLTVIQKKLLSIQDAGADCIAVMCPNCFLQFETGQLKLQKNNVDVNLPVFHISELLANAMGLETTQNILKNHKIMADIHGKKLKIKEISENLSKYFRLDLLKNCAECRACSKDCTLIKSVEYDPLKYVDLLIEGRIEEVLKDKGVWYCLTCYSCLEKCPQRMGLADFFMKLRNLATELGHGLEAINLESQKFLKDGVITGKLLGQRRRLNLPIETMDGINELKKLFGKNNELDVET
ncbi:MAG: 4Fe-4S dicluster domain-containing protein [Candidatus Lokiarchaeota archaeon]|nr:4Fe-4S dicluster domain-containing protein [Candidatus Lokiarchaeota archaeon]